MTYQTDEEVRAQFLGEFPWLRGIARADDATPELTILDFILTLRKNDRAVKYGEGYKQGKFDAQMEGCDCEEKTKEWLRSEVGKMKQDDNECDFNIGYHEALKNILSLLEPKTDV